MLSQELLQKLQFTPEDIPYILENDRIYGTDIEKLAVMYMEDKGNRDRKPYSGEEFQQRRSQMLAYLEKAKRVCGEDKLYISNLLFWLHCVRHVKPLYEQSGIAMDVYWESMADLSCKTRECKKRTGQVGSRVTWNWYSLFFDLLLFSLGRLQFYIETFTEDRYSCGGYTLRKGDTVYSCHIPSTGKLLTEDCMDSFQRAYEFFKEDLPSSVIPIVCHSWLLYPKYAEQVFPEGSNLQKFQTLFEIIATEETADFDNCGTVFQMAYPGSTDPLPRDTALQRNFIRYIDAGGTFGAGYGVILYDGKKREIINI